MTDLPLKVFGCNETVTKLISGLLDTNDDKEIFRKNIDIRFSRLEEY